MKDEADALGDIARDPPEAIGARCDSLSRSMRSGVVPDACRGCSTAAAIARARQPG